MNTTRTEFSSVPAERFHELESELSGLLTDNWIGNLANFSSLIFHALPELNWVGFYLQRGSEMVLGPFQGKPACLVIPEGKGVCGSSAKLRQTLIVADVHSFPGHIACDPNSRSEMVIPLIHGNRFIGVLDLDSPSLSRFQEADKIGLEKLAHILLQQTPWPNAF